ncbi:GMC family oxidoreductase [Aquamicrobium terrae]|uniref:5-(Hydroxymethyl)furfural/furfural oxidase n=1 Tax=Aquamicrobium terrae TaxID=1324945 RepID=A0ABV2N1J1_9HYPH
MSRIVQCDFVIVGGGTAGCVLASRLSENGRHRVILVESGRDTPPDRVEPAILDSYPRVAYFNVRNVWADLRVSLQPVPHNDPGKRQLRRYEQARLMGGGSSLNDMQANRGTPDDYDDWARNGATGWSWEEVLPFFRKAERDVDFDGPLHGQSGPIPIRRIHSDCWPEFARAAARAFSETGFKALQDQNGEFEDGYFPVAINNIYDRRVSTAIGYLGNSVRQRPNLEIWPNATVTRLVTEGARIVGVEVETGQGPARIMAGETIVSAGALHSPAILQRAGIGPARTLRALGIEVIADRAGVGRNLQEHPAISISAHINHDARLARTNQRRHIHVAARYSSGTAGGLPSDMYLVAMSKTGWHPVGEQIGSLMTWINKAHSRGFVAIESPDPSVEPRVEFGFLSDYRDVERLKVGMRLLARLYDTPAMKAVANDPFPTSYSERIRDLGIVSHKNYVLTRILATALDGPAWLRRTLLRHVVTEDDPVERMMADDELLEAFVREKAHGVWHASGTCKIGSADDPEAVVDPSGRVMGVDGLRVCDASVMPFTPRANTNLPTIMIAERMCALILQQNEKR